MKKIKPQDMPNQHLFSLVCEDKPQEALLFFKAFRDRINADCHYIDTHPDCTRYLTFICADKNFDELLVNLVEHSINLHYHDPRENCSLLHHVVKQGKWDIVERILLRDGQLEKKNRCIDMLDSHGATALSALIEHGQEELAILAVNIAAQVTQLHADKMLAGLSLRELALQKGMSRLADAIAKKSVDTQEDQGCISRFFDNIRKLRKR